MKHITNLFHEIETNRAIQISLNNNNNFRHFHSNLTNSNENINRLRGEYNETHDNDSINNNNDGNDGNNENNQNKERRNKNLSVNSFKEFQKESYLILSNIRSINFQVELLYQRQQKQNLNLKIEYNVLMSQFNEFIVPKDEKRKKEIQLNDLTI